MIDPLLEIGPHVTVLPVVHGSGDFAWEVRRMMLASNFDCLAVPLPDSFRITVEKAILEFPTPSVVVQRDLQTTFEDSTDRDWSISGDSDEADEFDLGASYVPIDPCQPVIAALRTAMGEHMPRCFIDLETSLFEPYSRVLPDAYSLKRVTVQQFAAAVLPHLAKPNNTQWLDRIHHMAWRLRELSVNYQRILAGRQHSGLALDSPGFFERGS